MTLSIWVKELDNNVLDLVKQKGFYPYWLGPADAHADQLCSLQIN